MACPAPCFVDAAPRNTLPTRVDTRRETDHPPRGLFVRSVLRVCRLAHRRLAQTRADTLNAQSTGNRKRGCATHLFLQGLAFCAVLAVLLCAGHRGVAVSAQQHSSSSKWAGAGGPAHRDRKSRRHGCRNTARARQPSCPAPPSCRQTATIPPCSFLTFFLLEGTKEDRNLSTDSNSWRRWRFGQSSAGIYYFVLRRYTEQAHQKVRRTTPFRTLLVLSL